MSKTFEDILTELLKEYETNPNKSIDEIIAEVLNQNDISDDAKSTADEVNSYLSKFDQKSKELENAKEAGETRIGWLENQLNETLSAFSEEEKNAFGEAMQKGIENVETTITSEE